MSRSKVDESLSWAFWVAELCKYAGIARSSLRVDSDGWHFKCPRNRTDTGLPASIYTAGLPDSAYTTDTGYLLGPMRIVSLAPERENLQLRRALMKYMRGIMREQGLFMALELPNIANCYTSFKIVQKEQYYGGGYAGINIPNHYDDYKIGSVLSQAGPGTPN